MPIGPEAFVDLPAPRPDNDAYVALGLLSTLVPFGRGRSSAYQSFTRRSLVRNATRAVATPELALRFLLAWPSPVTNATPVERSVARRKREAEVAPLVLAEQHTHGDLVTLNMTENFFECPRKYLLWLSVAPRLCPAARWIAMGDDDEYIQLSRFAMDLRLTQNLTDAERQPVLWGLIVRPPGLARPPLSPRLAHERARPRARARRRDGVAALARSCVACTYAQTWKIFFNNHSYDTSTGFPGWNCNDGPAVSRRRAVERCRDTALAAEAAAVRGSTLNDGSLNVSSKSPACGGLLPKQLAAVRRRSVDGGPPWPIANGPLFALSAPLARAMAEDTIPLEWLEGIQRTEYARWSRANGGQVPKPLMGFACFPMGDSVFSYWIYQIARARGLRPTLVNSPLGGQQFPWASWRFGNRSIVLHGLKGPNNPFWAYVQTNGQAPFLPIARTCGTCRSLGWSTWPGSIVHDWRCCGVRSFAPKTRGSSPRAPRRPSTRQRGSSRLAKARTGLPPAHRQASQPH